METGPYNADEVAHVKKCAPMLPEPGAYIASRLLDTIDALVKERDVWMLRATTGGVAELGVFNPNVASYCRELEARAEKAEAQRDAYISGREMQRDRADAATARADKAEKDRDDAYRAAMKAGEDFANATGRVCEANANLRALLKEARGCVAVNYGPNEFSRLLARIDAALEEKK